MRPNPMRLYISAICVWREVLNLKNNFCRQGRCYKVRLIIANKASRLNQSDFQVLVYVIHAFQTKVPDS